MERQGHAMERPGHAMECYGLIAVAPTTLYNQYRYAARYYHL